MTTQVQVPSSRRDRRDSK